MFDVRLRDIPDVEKVHFRPIPPALITSDMVSSDTELDKYHYEDWARELINASHRLAARAGDFPFVAPDSESHGEADAVAGSYGIDFKLILGQSEQRALRECSPQIFISHGVTYTCTSRSSNGMNAGRLHTALRDCSIEKLAAIRKMEKRDIKGNLSMRDINSFLGSIRHDKNLLLIFPCLFYGAENPSFSLETIGLALSRDFGNALELRMRWYPERELFLACFFQGCFVIFEFDGGRLRLFDQVPVSQSELFIRIAKLYDSSTYAPLDDLLGRRRC